MPTTTKAGATNGWLELEPGYEPPQQAEDVPEVNETASKPEQVAQVKQPRKRAAQAKEAIRD